MHARLAACSLLLVLALPSTLSAGEVLSLAPAVGTFGTQVLLELDGDPGPKKPMAFLERPADGARFALKVVDHDDHSVLVEVRTQAGLTAGSWSIVVQPKGKPQREPYVALEGLELVGPEILSVAPDVAAMGDEVTLTVAHLGTRKLPVWVAAKKAKVLSWDAALGQVVIRLPKKNLPAVAHLSLESPLGNDTFGSDLEIVDGGTADGPFSVNGKAVTVEHALQMLHLVPGSTAYLPVVAVSCEDEAQGKPRVFALQYQSPDAPQGADTAAGSPTFATFQLGQPETPQWKAWFWKSGDAFDLASSPLGGGLVQWQLECTLAPAASGKPVKLAGTFVSEDISHSPVASQAEQTALVLDGQVIDVDLTEVDDDDEYVNELWLEYSTEDDTTIVGCELYFHIGDRFYSLYAWADRDGVFDPAIGPIAFTAQEMSVDLYDDETEVGWGSEAGPLGNPSYTFLQVPGSDLLEVRVVATLPGPGGPRPLHVRFLADSRDWE